MRSISPPSEPLSDGQISLRPAAERDIPEILIAYQDDPQMHLLLGEERPPSGAELGRRMEAAQSDMDQGISIRLTITEAGSDDCAGQITVHGFEFVQSRAEIGIWVAPRLRSRGIARRALALAAPWLFDTCRLQRIALLTEPDNEPLLHAARGAGFVHEGVLRAYMRRRGGRVDMAVLSLTPTDLQQP
jgi:RimJ/RimL family protein N-acetyltransferase